LCAQLAPDQWRDRVEEKILADAIIDRITAGAVVATLDSDQSLRRHFADAAR
jgi:hypothetical protein